MSLNCFLYRHILKKFDPFTCPQCQFEFSVRASFFFPLFGDICVFTLLSTALT